MSGPWYSRATLSRSLWLPEFEGTGLILPPGEDTHPYNIAVPRWAGSVAGIFWQASTVDANAERKEQSLVSAHCRRVLLVMAEDPALVEAWCALLDLLATERDAHTHEVLAAWLKEIAP